MDPFSQVCRRFVLLPPPLHPIMRSRLRTSALAVCFCLPTLACETPESRQENIAPQVKNAAKYLESDPDKALLLLDKATDKKTPLFLFSRGRAYEAKKDLKKAAADYEAALKLQADDTDIRRSLARVLPLIGRAQDAKKHFDLLLKTNPRDLSSLLIYVALVDTPQQAARAAQLLHDFPKTLPKKEQKKLVPAEVHLALSLVEDTAQARSSALDRAREASLSSPSAALNLAQYALHLKRGAYATALLQKLVENQEPKPNDSELEQLALLALRQHNLPLAGAALKKVSVLDSSPLLKAIRGEYLLETGSTTESVLLLKEAWLHFRRLKSPQAARLGLMLARAHLQKEETKQAIEVLEKVEKRTPQLLDAQLLLAHARALSDDPKIKEKGLSSFSHLAPAPGDAPRVALQLGRTQLQIGQNDAAAETFRQLLEKPPFPAPVVQLLVTALNLSKKEDEALIELKRVVEQAPQDIQLRRILANQYLRVKKPAAAAQAVEAMPPTEANRLERTLLLADVFQSTGRREKIEALLLQLVEELPSSSRAWTALSVHQIHEKKWAEAEESLRKSLILAPRDLKQRARLASVLLQLEKPKDAAQQYERLISMAQDDAIALNNIAALYTDELNEIEKGIDYAERALRLRPNSAAFKDTLAWALIQRGTKKDLTRALRLFKEAAPKLSSPSSQFHYGAALLQAGKKQEGKKLLEKARDAARPDSPLRDQIDSLLK